MKILRSLGFVAIGVVGGACIVELQLKRQIALLERTVADMRAR